ncbi:MAG: MopE-related protein [Saprospiraceae bacterium]
MKKSIQSTWAKNPVNQFATSKLCRAFYLLVILIMAIGMGQAATITWDGSSSTSWTSAANWSSNSVPTASDNVIIPGGVPNFPFISTSVTVKSVDIQEDAKLDISSNGTLNVSGATSVGIYVRGELKSNGKIFINNTGGSAIYVSGSDGNAKAYLYGDTYIGNSGSVGGDGIIVEDLLTVDTDPVFYYDQTPTLIIDNVSGNGLSCFFGTINIRETGSGLFTSNTQVKIGTVGTIGNIGIASNGDFNFTAGTIIIEDSGTGKDGLTNATGGDFTLGSKAELKIGSATAQIAGQGINNQDQFSSSGLIEINNTGSHGINNTGTFTNTANINIGASAPLSGDGVKNNGGGTFTNQGCFSLLHIFSNNIINNSGNFANGGTIIEEASGNSSISTNTGIVQNLNGGTFTISTNNGALTTASGKLWTGCANDLDWATATNWTGETVPTTSDDVIIPPSINPPNISQLTAAFAKSVTVLEFGDLSIDPNCSLTVSGSAGFGITNEGGIYNAGTIKVDNTGLSGIYNYSTGFFHNAISATIEIGNNGGNIGANGIQTFGGTFYNEDSDIHIDNCTSSGIYNQNGTFINWPNSQLFIGLNDGNIGVNGIFNSGASGNFTNNGGTIKIDNASNVGIANEANLSNEATGEIHIGQESGIGAVFNSSDGTIANLNCATFTLNNRFTNSGTTTNAGYFYINTDQFSPNGGTFTNNGVVAFAQLPVMGGIVNNDIIVPPVDLGCPASNDVLQIGGSNSFTIASQWLNDENLTDKAGDYDQANNTFTPTNLLGGAQPLYFTATNGACTLDVSTTINAVAGGDHIWTGAVDSDWGNSCNWSPLGVPSSDDDVIIPDVANDPIIGATTFAFAKSVTVENGGYLTFEAGGTLAIDGSDADALVNQDGGTVNNYGTLNIGTNVAIGGAGVLNNGIFVNETGANINVDNCTTIGIQNSDASGTGDFSNYGKITIGENGSIGDEAILNDGNFLNSGCGSVIETFAPVFDNSTFTNDAIVIVHSNGQTKITDNNFLVVVLNNGSVSLPGNDGYFTRINGYYWTGCTDSDWHNASNWHSGMVPTADDRVVIFPVANMPQISGAAIARSVYMDKNTQLVINSSGSLSVENSPSDGLDIEGDLINDGTIDIGQNGGHINYTGIALSHGSLTNNNSGVINIDNTNYEGLSAFNSAHISNFGIINIGQNGGSNNIGYNGLWVADTLHNNGVINIDNTGSYGMRSNGSSAIFNTGSLNIGQNGGPGNIGSDGLQFTSGKFYNQNGGIMNIDNTKYSGIFLNSNFFNEGNLNIGMNGGAGNIGDRGISCAQKTFENNNGGVLKIDNTDNESINIYVGASFINNPCSKVFLYTEPDISSTSTIFENNGLLYVEAGGLNSSKIVNNGVIENIQGATFGGTNNDLIIAPVSGACTLSDVLQIGGANDFTPAAEWFADPAMTDKAGDYDSANNSFMVTNLAGNTTHTLYFTTTGNGCTFDNTIAVTLDADTEAPTAVCPNPTIELDANGTYTLTTDDVIDPVNSSDNCGAVVATSITPANFDCSSLGAHVVTVETADLSGNAGNNCTANVTVILPVNPATGLRTWTGAYSTDWEEPCNWSPLAVPTSDDEVVIPNVTNDPVIDLAIAAVAKSVVIETGGKLTIEMNGSLTIDGSTNDGMDISGTLVSNGTVHIDNVAGNGVEAQTGSSISNFNTLNIGQNGGAGNIGGKGLEIRGALTNQFGGTINVTNTASNGMNVIGASVDNFGDIVVSASNISTGLLLNNSGASFTNKSGSSLTIDGFYTGYDGASNTDLINEGTLIFDNQQSYAIDVLGDVTNTGTVKGNGTFIFNGGYTWDGTISPGLSPGSFALNDGDPVTLAASCKLEIEVNGTTPVSEFDRVRVINEDINLNGTLAVTINYTPTIGDRIIFVEADNVNGTFATFSPALPNFWSVDYSVAGEVALVYDVPCGTNTWTGAAGTNWDDADNWTLLVPKACDDVVIPDVANAPIIGSTTAAVAKSVTVEADALLTITSGGSLALDDVSNNTGIDNFGEIANGGTITVDGPIGDGIYNAGIFDNSGTIQIGTTQSPTEQGIQILGTMTNTGTLDVKRGNDKGIQIDAGGELTNESSGHILLGQNGGAFDDYGMLVAGTFTNDGGSVLADNAGVNGIRSEGTISNLNGGDIGIGTTDGNIGWVGLILDDGATFTNDASTLNINNTGTYIAGLGDGIASFHNSLFENKNGSTINLGLNAGGIGHTGIYLWSGTFNNEDSDINIDNVGNDGIYTAATFNNYSNINIGTADGNIGGDGIQTTGGATFSNLSCAVINLADNLNNGTTFINDGYLKLNTSETHNVGNFINNGIVEDVQGTFSGGTNNEIITAATSSSDCESISPAFELGASMDFTIVGIYTDENATQSAGLYDVATNTFTPTNPLSQSAITFYVKIEDPVGGCTRIVKWVVNATDCCPALVTCYLDSDGDNFGDAANSQVFCQTCETGYVLDNTDCDDGDADEFPGQTWYLDLDGDLHSDGTSQTACERPTNYFTEDELTATDGDCDDFNPYVFPGNPEVCDGQDNNCDGQVDEGLSDLTYTGSVFFGSQSEIDAWPSCYTEITGELYIKGSGINDLSPLANITTVGQSVTVFQCYALPSLEGLNNLTFIGYNLGIGSNTLIENLDPLANVIGVGNQVNINSNSSLTNLDGLAGLTSVDGSLNVSSNASLTNLDGLDNVTSVGNDLTVTNNAILTRCCGIHSLINTPGAVGGAITIMDNETGCDSEAEVNAYCEDADDDSFTIGDGDCDDSDPNEFPGQIWYLDFDGDLYSDGTSQTTCERPANYFTAGELTQTSGDCNDGDAAINPAATEVCDGVDNDCDGQTDNGVLITYYADSDGDGFGDPANSILDCSAPTGYVLDNTDCDDSDGKEFPGQIWYLDFDGDLYSDGTSQTACERPANYFTEGELTETSGDCNDGDPSINPAATEVCDGVDNNCDGQADNGVLITYYADTDGDGFGDPANMTQACSQPLDYVLDNTDCDDSDGNEFPGQTWYLDFDGDLYSDGTSQTACERPANYFTAGELTQTSGDCNDSDAAINPEATEICDGVDNDCDGQTDNGVLITYYADTDGDGFGDPANSTMACSQPIGYVSDNTDCDDSDGNEFPGQTWYLDFDGDLYSDGTSQVACERPANYFTEGELTETSGDCNDGDPAINPAATEVCDGVDNNCDGQTDNGVLITYYADSDGDGFGDPANSILDCSAPTGYVLDNTDCDDSDGKEFPGQIWYLDFDGDLYSDGTSQTACERPANYFTEGELIETSGDCNDGDPAINPAATEVCDGVDNNCDGQTDNGVLTTYYADTDGDGFGDPANSTMACSQPVGYISDNTDCDDSDGNEFPGQTWYLDFDGDLYSDGTSQVACERPANYFTEGELTETSGDCNDGDPAINPAATEVCDGVDNNCDGQTDNGVLITYYADTDGDGFGDPAVSTMDCSAPTGYVLDNTDCDDNDGNEFPGQTWYLDFDGDLYSDGTSQTVCERPANYFTAGELTQTGGDCNDGDPAINPAVTEVCDGVDNDCDGQADNGVLTTYYADTDGDGFGDPTNITMACAQPTGYISDNTDCDDSDGKEFPGQTWYLDFDGDLYSDGTSQTACERPANYFTAGELTQTSGDCNDSDAAINPAATEVCDGMDNDCDGQTDNGVLITYYADTDGDGFGDPANSILDCSASTGYVSDNTDCDDSDGKEFPGQTWYLDFDGDLYSDGTSQTACERPANYFTEGELTETSGDCNDGDPSINPAATEVCDGVDNNCDGQADNGVLITYYADTDGDGFGDPANSTMACSQPVGYVSDNTDCDDNDGNEFPGQIWYLDFDGDLYSDGTSQTVCEHPANYFTEGELTETSGDCNDGDPSINPAATEVCDGIDNDCDGLTDIDDPNFVDNTLPTVNCQNIARSLDANGSVQIVPADVFAGGSDDCGTVNLLGVSPNTFSCGNLGANTVTLTVDDGNGNQNNCQATVSISDGTAPEAACQNITVQLDVSGQATISAADVDGGSGDVCGIGAMQLDNTSFSCANVGSNAVILTVFDNNSNSSSCTATITVEDNVQPNAVCKTTTVQLDGSGMANILPALVDNGSNDACGIAGLSLNITSFTCANVGANAVVLTVTDVNGNSSTCSTTVTVQDSTAPSVQCQNATVQLDVNGLASIVPADVDGGSDDACGSPSLSLDINTFSCANLGGNSVTLTATDLNGNMATCTATVTVEDDIAPTAVCQNTTVQLDGNGIATLAPSQVDGGSTDNCSVSLSLDNTSFSCANVGPNTVTLTAIDPAGNSHSCLASLTVEDNTAPTALCQNATAFLDEFGQASISANEVDAGSSDNCGIASASVSPNSFTCVETGANTVTLTVADVNGNTAACNATVEVVDNLLPIVICRDISIQLDATGNASIIPTDVFDAAASSDNCGNISLVNVWPNQFSCQDEGANTATLTANDGHGNTATCTATVTVKTFITGFSVTVTPEECGMGNGTIIASADSPGGQLAFSIDGGATWQMTGVFTNLPTGAYHVKVKAFGTPGCSSESLTTEVGQIGSPTTWWKDWDGDGYTDGISQTTCNQPVGYVASALPGDCNDNNADEHPGQVWYKDMDGDGYSDGTWLTQCTQPWGYETADKCNATSGDCNDNNAAVHPGAIEICNNVDDDCDGQIDEGVPTGLTWNGNVVFSNQAAVDAWPPCYTIINGNLTIQYAGINDLSALLGLVEVTGNVLIQNTSLDSLAGLDSLEAVGGTLAIKQNGSLTTLDGLDSLTAVDGNLQVFQNLDLTSCCAIHDLINNGVGGSISIFLNDTGCDNVADVNNTCAPVQNLVGPGGNSSAAACADCVLEGQSNPDLHLFPNPTSSTVNVQLDGLAGVVNLSIMDVAGRVFYKTELERNGKLKIETGDWKAGIYLVKVKSESREIVTKKLVVVD